MSRTRLQSLVGLETRLGLNVFVQCESRVSRTEVGGGRAGTRFLTISFSSPDVSVVRSRWCRTTFL